MKEPRRLLQSDESTPLLRDALRALEQRGPSPAALERMHAALPVTAPAAGGGQSATGPAAASGASISHAILLGLAVSGALTLHGVAPPLRSGDPAAIPQPTPPAAVAPAIELPTAAAEPETQPAPPSPRRTRKRAAAEREPPPSARAEPSNAPIVASEPEPTPEPEPAPPQAPAASQSAPRATPTPVAEPTATRAKLDPQDEASLLYRAKRLAGTDPRAALRLLAAHADSFPNGALAEEREVLTIQLHRKLGDSATAQRLAAEFRARHPRSLYLGSLGP